jgi:hypothetical protein
LAFISDFNLQLLYLPGLKNVVADFLFRPNQTTTGSVTAMSAADSVDFEEMATEQNRCPERQHFLGNTSLKFAFRQTGAKRLAGDVSTGNFRPMIKSDFLEFKEDILKFKKVTFDHFHNVAHPRRLASHHIISSRFVWRGLSSLGPRVSGLPAGQDPPPHAPGPPTHPRPLTAFFSPPF